MSSSHIQIAVLGAGRWGPNLIRNFNLHSKATVKWVVDKDPQRLQAIQAHFKEVQTSTEVDAVLSDEAIDAVVVASPTQTHFILAKAALEKKKHVFVEKPLAGTLAQSQELVALAKRVDKKLMVGHVFLFNPGILEIKRLVDEGALGDIHYAYSIRTNLGPIRGDVNALWDLAPHDISIFLFLLGASVTSVTAHGASFINPPTEDVAFARMNYASGCFANLHVSWLDPKKVRQLVLVGSRKMLLFDDIGEAPQVRVFDKNVSGNVSETRINDTIQLFRKSIVEGAVEEIPIGPSEPLKNECNAFVDWVIDEIPQPSEGDLGVKVVESLDAMTRSMHQGGAVMTLDA